MRYWLWGLLGRSRHSERQITWIPTLLHEQNVVPGLANRFLSRWANSVALSFSESTAYLKGKNVWVSGLPIRPDIGQIGQAEGRTRFGLAADVTTYLAFGGSLGAQWLNTLAVGAWSLLVKEGRRFQVIHVTGRRTMNASKNSIVPHDHGEGSPLLS